MEEGVWEMDGCALLRTDISRCKHAIQSLLLNFGTDTNFMPRMNARQFARIHSSSSLHSVE